MRRRDFVAAGHAAHRAPPTSVREGVRRALALATAIESALKGGYCPACGAKFGRAVRQHFETCDGGSGE